MDSTRTALRYFGRPPAKSGECEEIRACRLSFSLELLLQHPPQIKTPRSRTASSYCRARSHSALFTCVSQLRRPRLFFHDLAFLAHIRSVLPCFKALPCHCRGSQSCAQDRGNLLPSPTHWIAVYLYPRVCLASSSSLLHFYTCLGVANVTSDSIFPRPTAISSTTMESSGPGTKQVEHETESLAKRTTKDGRKLTYRLKVIQQPSRARACGSGAKCEFCMTTQLTSSILTNCSIGRPPSSRSSTDRGTEDLRGD